MDRNVATKDITTEMTSKAEEIMDVAEDLARSHGYNAFSFRDLATRVGIKSASVHYHFPTKADLGAALARRYTDRFIEALNGAIEPTDTGLEIIQRYAAAYHRALVEDGRMCLCGLFAAEVDTLPESVVGEVKRFFEVNINWLKDALRRDPQVRSEEDLAADATFILTMLQGAMLVGRSLDQPDAVLRMMEKLRTTDIYTSRVH